MLERRKLAAQLVRAQAMLWSTDDPHTKLRLRRMMDEIERRIAALDSPDIQPRPIMSAGAPRPRSR